MNTTGSGPATVPRQDAPLDVNAETYPYDLVQHLLDQSATFTFYATPVPGFFEEAVLVPGAPEDFFGINGGYGVHLCCDLHAFECAPRVSCGTQAIAVRQSIGPAIGRLRCIALFGASTDQTARWRPGQPPTPVIFDRWRSQRVILTDPRFTFHGGEGFRGFGIGRTYPSHVPGGPRPLLGAVGNVVDGTGAFAGHTGSFAFCGRLTANLGFEGVISCRLPDPQGDLRCDESPEMEGEDVAGKGDTFIVLRGEKKDRSVRTAFGPSPGPNLHSLVTPSQMRAVSYGCSRGGQAPRASMTAGAVVARMDADVHFNLDAPPGTAAAPGAFTTRELYEFVDACGNEVGTISARVEEGISFGLKFRAAPGQPGVRFTGYGPVTGGTGALSSVQGLLTVNSVIGIAPHALSLTHVLHLVDPAGRFRRTS